MMMSRVTLVCCLATGLLAPAVTAQSPTVIRIGTLPGLRFDTAAFSVRPGSAVEIVFSNYDEMLHNFVVTRPGSRERVIKAADSLGAGAADRDFVPASADVLWATKVVPTGQSFTLKFTAPKQPGDYPYLCTLPGHGIVMFGTMRVSPTLGPTVMTAVEPTAPVDHSAHTGPVTRGTVMRAFMPEAGPASIAVQLPGGVSYVFDAGAGRFRYAWTGGYMTRPASPERGLARINGQVFYREGAFPVRIGASADAAPKLVEFKGYAVDATNVPEFETVVDGVTVRERAEVTDGKLVRRFRVAGATTVWFAGADAGPAIEVTGATREGAFFKLSGPAAQEFTVVVPVPAAAEPAAPAPAPAAPR